jgi:hypothetical protein
MRTYISLLAYAIAAAMSQGCSGEPGPVMAYELYGTWCTFAEPDETCLLVDNGPMDRGSGEITYMWYVGYTLGNARCFEAGVLTGGLEFTPDTDSRLCLAPEYGLYSAGGEWTGYGLRLIVDTLPGEQRAMADDPGRVLELHYRP